MSTVRKTRIVVPVLVSVLLTIPGMAGADGVFSFTGADIRVRAPGGFGLGPPTPLCLDPAACAPGEVMAFSVPSHRDAIITVTGIPAAGAAAQSVELIDEDILFDDTLDTHAAPTPPGGAPFSITLHITCFWDNTLDGGGPAAHARVSSGEQTAELAVEDGSTHIPKDDTWQVSCDKETSTTCLPQAVCATAIQWGEGVAAVTIPPGGVNQATTLTMKNSLPIFNPSAVPPGFLPISEAVVISSNPSVMLTKPASVLLPYTNGEIEGYDESHLQILKFDRVTGAWNPIGFQRSDAANAFLFEISQFGIYGFAGPPMA